MSQERWEEIPSSSLISFRLISKNKLITVYRGSLSKQRRTYRSFPNEARITEACVVPLWNIKKFLMNRC